MRMDVPHVDDDTKCTVYLKQLKVSPLKVTPVCLHYWHSTPCSLKAWNC